MPTDNSTPELKNCPFCGGKPEIEQMGTPRVSMIITCTDCGCILETGETWIDENSGWNTRTPEWQPIETAPKDETYFCGWHKIHKCSITIAFAKGENTLSKNDIYLEKTKTTFWPIEVFTHWQPLPPLPATKEGE